MRYNGGMATDVESRSVAETLAPLLQVLLGRPRSPVRIEFWDNSVIESDGPPGGAGSPGTLRINSPDAIRRVVWMPNQLGFGRAYVAGEIEADGDFIDMVEAFRGTVSEDLRFRSKAVIDAIAAAKRAGVIGRPLPPPPQEVRLKGRLHSLRRDSRAISHHYDVGNDFYRIVLGESMTYSCARFVDENTSLEDAQTAKHDLVARKLGLDQSEGLRLLDVGCGWGSMVIHAAARYGVQAVGITISREQAEYARKRVGEAGVGDKVEIRLQDYRELGDEQFDAISSIGMAEHVGAKRIDEYFAILHKALVPTGRLLNHAISSVGGFEARPLLVRRPLRVPRRRAARCRRHGAGDGAGRLRDPRRRVAARALRQDVAGLGGQSGGQLGRRGGRCRRRAGADLASVHGRFSGRVHGWDGGGSTSTKSSASYRRRAARAPSRPPGRPGSDPRRPRHPRLRQLGDHETVILLTQTVDRRLCQTNGSPRHIQLQSSVRSGWSAGGDGATEDVLHSLVGESIRGAHLEVAMDLAGAFE